MDRARLSDVARLAGVTKGIASRVLNSDPAVAVREETRERILQAARTLNYHPHAGARALATAHTRTLALLVPALDNQPYVTIARGAYRRAAESGYLALLAEDTPDQRPQADLFARGRVDGVIVGSATHAQPLIAQLRERDIPHVFVNRAVPGSGRNITMNVARASDTAIDHLTTLGHARIVALAGPVDVEPSRLRLEGFVRAVREAGLAVIDPVHAGFTEADGASAVDALLQRQPSAVVTSSLGQAIGVLRGLHDRGIAVPAEVSVVAYDDFPIAKFTVPSLTTIEMPLAELGAIAVDELIAQLGGTPPRDVLMPTIPRIIVRESTAQALTGR